MLFNSTIILLTASALSSIQVTRLQLTRCGTLILLFAGVMGTNTLNVSAMGPGVSLYEGIIQVTPLSQTTDIFISVIACVIVGHVWTPVSYIETLKATSTSVTPVETTSTSVTPVETTSSSVNTTPVETTSGSVNTVSLSPPLNETSGTTKHSDKINKNPVKTFQPAVAEYSVIVLFTTLGAIIFISSTSLVTVYLGVELQSFAVYILASLYWNSDTASSAALKYFFIGGLSSAFILIGGAVVYWQTGSTDLWHVFNLLNQLPSSLILENMSGETSSLVHNHAGTLLGLEAIVLGILMKTASAPFHFWAPDVYDGVPTVVTTWLTLMPKISLLGFVLHVSGNLYSIEVIGGPETWYTPATWSTLLATGSILSLIIGTVVGLAQNRVKRLLAYSTISHVGFLLLAVSVNTEIGIDAFTFYLTQYTITTLDAFLILLALGYCLRPQNKDLRAHETDIENNIELSGQFQVNTVIGLAFSACLFSMAGVPPLVGFFGKQAVLYAAIQAEYGFLAFVGIVTSVVSASYYLGLIRNIHFETPTYSYNIIPQAIAPVHSYAIAIFTLVVSLFILAPTLALDSTGLLALAFHTA